ncbi:MAG: GxxExxY protein [Phycisphaerales bacterium]
MAHPHHNRRRPPQSRPTLRNDELDPTLSEISSRVIGCAIEVHKQIGPGFGLEVYENAMAIALKEAGVKFKKGHIFPVKFNEESVGEVRVSFFVDDRFIVQIINENREIDGLDRTILRSILRVAGLGLAVGLSFALGRMKNGGLVRVLNPDKLDEIRAADAPRHDDHDDEYDDEYEDEYDDEYEDEYDDED